MSAVLKTICWWRNEWLFIRQTSSKFKWIAQDQPCTYWLDWVQTHIRVSSNPAHTLQYAGNLRHLSTANRFLGEERGCKGNKLDWHSNSVRSSRVFAEMPLCLRCGTEPVPALLGFFFSGRLSSLGSLWLLSSKQIFVLILLQWVHRKMVNKVIKEKR